VRLTAKWISKEALGTPWTALETPSPHLEPDATLLTAQASQHEDDDSEEPRERHSHHSKGGRPGELTERGVVCRERDV
jgi:hypothetical protein